MATCFRRRTRAGGDHGGLRRPGCRSRGSGHRASGDGPPSGRSDSGKLRPGGNAPKCRLTAGPRFETLERSGGGVSRDGVPERTCSLTSGRTLDGIGRQPEGRFGAAEGVAGTSAERTALSQYGEGTLEGLLDSRSRARPLVVEDPGGPGRLQGASPKAVRKPRGGWPPDRGGATGGGRAPGRMKPRRGASPTVPANSRPAGSDSGDGKPRGRGGGSRAGSGATLAATKCAAGGPSTSWG